MNMRISTINLSSIFFILALGFFLLVPLAQAGSQTFNSSGTFVVPPGVMSISVTASAGGGGGANAFAAGHPMIGASYYNGAGGGSGGNIRNQNFTVTPGSSLAVTVGTGGSGTINGGNTSLGSLFTLTGGASAYYLGSTLYQLGSGGSPNGQNGGDFSCAGASGAMSCSGPATNVAGTGGGNTVGGVPGVGGVGSCASGMATRGAGGGGNSWAGGCLGFGTAGGDGFVTITWPDPSGTLTVTANNAAARYTLTGPTTLTGSGLSTTHTNVVPGTYTITWDPIVDYTAPPTSSKTLISGGTQSFSGTYTLTPRVEINFGI